MRPRRTCRLTSATLLCAPYCLVRCSVSMTRSFISFSLLLHQHTTATLHQLDACLAGTLHSCKKSRRMQGPAGFGSFFQRKLHGEVRALRVLALHRNCAAHLPVMFPYDG